jgi:hypothetical protein
LKAASKFVFSIFKTFLKNEVFIFLSNNTLSKTPLLERREPCGAYKGAAAPFTLQRLNF